MKVIVEANFFLEKEPAEFENIEVQAGKHIVDFNPGEHNLASGVYYFSLTGSGINKQRKIVYQK